MLCVNLQYDSIEVVNSIGQTSRIQKIKRQLFVCFIIECITEEHTWFLSVYCFCFIGTG